MPSLSVDTTAPLASSDTREKVDTTTGSDVAASLDAAVKDGHEPRHDNGGDDVPDIQYPGYVLYTFLVMALLLASFLVALDVNIITTAVPTITAEFHSVEEVGWYGSAFFMCAAAFPAFWGKAYKHFSLKTVFLASITIFEIGSLVAALAPNSSALIAGRAIQGVGSAGVASGSYTICGFITTPKHVPGVLALFAFVWTLSSVIGPIIGGAFTTYVTWRWCFYVNLPIGGAAIIIIALLFKTPAHALTSKTDLRKAPLLFDFPGVALLLGALVCYILALEDAGTTRPWSSSYSIGLLVGFAVLALVFAGWEIWQGEMAMVVPRILKNRTMAVLGLFNFLSQCAGISLQYNVPIFFQAAQGVAAAESGIRTLPMILSTSIFCFLSSVILSKTGYYQPLLWFGAALMTIGSGLIYTFDPSTTSSEYIGYQVLFGFGQGTVIQVNLIVAQTISTPDDMAVAVAIAVFWQSLAGALGVSAAQSILNNILVKSLEQGARLVSPAAVLTAGVAGLSEAFPDPADLMAVVAAYMQGLRGAWIWCIVTSGLSFLVAFAGEWRNVLPDDGKGREAKTRNESSEV